MNQCCIEGCINSTADQERDKSVTFYEFPTDQGEKLSWLEAIGCPNWDPPSDATICGEHFVRQDNNISSDDDVAENPPHVDYKASEVEVCRVCLATNVKMFPLRDDLLKTYLALTRTSDQHVEGLPEFACYECANALMKSFNLMERSLIAQTTLLEIYSEYGQISQSLIQSLDRSMLSLTSPLSYHNKMNIYHYKYDANQKSSQLTTPGSDNTTVYLHDASQITNNGTIIVPYKKLENDVYKEYFMEFKEEIKDNESDIEAEMMETAIGEMHHCQDSEELFDYDSGDDVRSDDMRSDYITSDVEAKKSGLYVLYLDNKQEKNSKMQIDNSREEKRVENSEEGNENSEELMEHFNVVKLSLEEQISEWNDPIKKEDKNLVTVFECLICSKLFTRQTMYQQHVIYHDGKEGTAACPVCDTRFSSERAARAHAAVAHRRRYHCDACPKVFNNKRIAHEHMRWHRGRGCTCAHCAYSSARESALAAHVRAEHRDLRKDTDDGRPALCALCKIMFVSERAKRVHLLSAAIHRKKYGLPESVFDGPALKTTCRQCGEQFPTTGELVAHAKRLHAPPPLSIAGVTPYPAPCAHCNETMPSRRAHYWHYMWKHPKESYQPVLTAYCDTCGKGFQNPAKLQQHVLRHSAPAVRCSQCPRTFYDKYALARHMPLHDDARPHRCRLCGLAFKQKTNLMRHAKVHSSERNYKCSMCDKAFKYTTSMNLHIRTVHYKMPHPPRKKRQTKKKKQENTNDNVDYISSVTPPQYQ